MITMNSTEPTPSMIRLPSRLTVPKGVPEKCPARLKPNTGISSAETGGINHPSVEASGRTSGFSMKIVTRLRANPRMPSEPTIHKT